MSHPYRSGTLARINVEDDFWTHPRYRALTRIIGDEDKAAGMCIRFWRLAQSYWGERKPVPTDVWDLEKLEPLVTVGLAEKKDDGVYCKNSERHFEWYSQAVESGRRGGIKSVRARTDKYGSAQPRRSKPSKGSRSDPSVNIEGSPKGSRSDPPEAPKPLTLYDAGQTEIAKAPPGSSVWDAYAGAYLGRYKVAPVRNARSNGMCAQLVKRLGVDAAIGVVRFYVTHSSSYYVQKAHALGPCLADCEALHTQMLNGMTITRASASHADKGAANQAAFAAVAAKWAAEDKQKGGADGE